MFKFNRENFWIENLVTFIIFQEKGWFRLFSILAKILQYISLAKLFVSFYIYELPNFSYQKYIYLVNLICTDLIFQRIYACKIIATLFTFHYFCNLLTFVLNVLCYVFISIAQFISLNKIKMLEIIFVEVNIFWKVCNI